MASMKKRLPKDFGVLLRSGDLDAVRAVFDSTEIDARDGASGPTALGMYGLPAELVGWLVARGADVDATDGHHRTPLWRHAGVGSDAVVGALLDAGANLRPPRWPPLHAAAGSGKPATVRLLLDRGADPLAVAGRRTALAEGLRSCANTQLVGMAEVAELLLAAGTPVTDEMRESVTVIGTRFEFIRPDFNPARLPAADQGLTRLYELFDVPPVPRRQVHTGTGPITMPTAEGWAAQHQQLWAQLVPGKGPAATVQGEVIRVTGRLAHELLDNGGINWDRDFRTMANALPGYLAAGVPLAEAELTEATTLASTLCRDSDEGAVRRLSELAVHWVLANPDPVPLPAPPYTR